MAEQWPSSVPYAPHGDSLRVKPFRDPYMTETEDGPVISRPSSTLTVATLEFQILMTSAELSAFKTWVKQDLVQGTLQFEMLVWSAGVFVQKQCRFASTYQVSASADGIHAVRVSIDVDDY